MVFLGHLDFMRLLDRAFRRAALPVSADNSPFHARPQIYTAGEAGSAGGLCLVRLQGGAEQQRAMHKP